MSKQKKHIGYFIQCKDTNYYKMGVTSECQLNKRLMNLQTGCPFDLIVNTYSVLGFTCDREFFWEEFIGGHLINIGQSYGIKRMRGEWIDFGCGEELTKQIITLIKSFKYDSFGYDSDMLKKYIELIMCKHTNFQIRCELEKELAEQNSYIEQVNCMPDSFEVDSELVYATKRKNGLENMIKAFV